MKKLSILFTFSIFLLFGCLSCKEDSKQQEKESTEEISRLINPYMEPPHGTTGLHYASSSGDINEIKSLLRIGFDVNARNEYGATPLHYVATGNGTAEIAKLLIENGAVVNVRRYGHRRTTPLHNAIEFRKAGVVKVLIEAGAYVCKKDYPRYIAPLRSAQNQLASTKKDAIQDKNKADWVIELRKKKLKNSEEVVKLIETAMKKQGCGLHPTLK